MVFSGGFSGFRKGHRLVNPHPQMLGPGTRTAIFRRKPRISILDIVVLVVRSKAHRQSAILLACSRRFPQPAAASATGTFVSTWPVCYGVRGSDQPTLGRLFRSGHVALGDELTSRARHGGVCGGFRSRCRRWHCSRRLSPRFGVFGQGGGSVLLSSTATTALVWLSVSAGVWAGTGPVWSLEIDPAEASAGYDAHDQ